MTLETSLPGVFAVGDVRRGSVKRVASAAGEGAMAIHFRKGPAGHPLLSLVEFDELLNRMSGLPAWVAEAPRS